LFRLFQRCADGEPSRPPARPPRRGGDVLHRRRRRRRASAREHRPLRAPHRRHRRLSPALRGPLPRPARPDPPAAGDPLRVRGAPEGPRGLRPCRGRAPPRGPQRRAARRAHSATGAALRSAGSVGGIARVGFGWAGERAGAVPCSPKRPLSTGSATLMETVKIIRQSAQIPAVTRHSVRLGAYSTSSCRVLGTKPGTINPIPFSIQTPTKASAHATFKTSLLVREAGRWSSSAEATLKATADQIQGTRPCFPWDPKNRYFAAVA